MLIAALEQAVREAWTKTLPDAEFRPARSWEACGGDSISALGLLMRLEKALEIKLGFDVITPEMTPRDLAQALGMRACRPEAVSATVFLLPGMYGDEPMLADFRRAVGKHVRFELLDMPAPSNANALLTSVPALAEVAANDIMRRAPEGSVMVAGYSLGAAIAYEAAQLLRQGGRTIALLALLDPPFDVHTHLRQKARGGMLSLLRQDPRGAGRIVAELLRRFALGRSLMLRAFSWLRPADYLRARHYIISYLSMKALQSWRPAPSGAPVFACVSEAFAPVSVAKLQSLAPGSCVIVVPGKHRDLFRGPALEQLVPEFQSAVLEKALL